MGRRIMALPHSVGEVSNLAGHYIGSGKRRMFIGTFPRSVGEVSNLAGHYIGSGKI